MLVADAASDIAAKLITAELAGRVRIIKTNLAAGPDERRLFRGQRFSRGIIFSILRISYWRRNGVSLAPWFSAYQGQRKIRDRRRSHSAKRGRTRQSAIQKCSH